MPYDSSGIYGLPAGYLATTGQTVLASQHNTPLQDIAAALSSAFLRTGVAPMQANIAMGGHRVTNLGDATSDSDAVSLSQLNSAVAGLATVPTGATQGFRSKTAPAGWVIENGGTIGNAASGATTRANADTAALFAHLWTQFNNTELPIQDSAGAASTRGASAAADYAANKRMPLFENRSRFQRGADSGLGYDANLTVGATQADEIKSHGHGVTDPGHSHTMSFVQGVTAPGTAERIQAPPGTGSYATSTSTTGITIQSTGGTETRPRSSVVLFCIKL